MKRVHFSLAAILFLGVPLLASAADFTGAPYCSNNAPCNNVPGVIWNTANGQSGKMSFTNTDNLYSDLGFVDGKAIRVDVNGTASFNMGNWYLGGNKPLTFTVNGDLKTQPVVGQGGVLGSRGRIDAAEYCINGGSCISTWPSVTDNFVNTTGDSMNGALTINGNLDGQSLLNINNSNANTGKGTTIYGKNRGIEVTSNMVSGDFSGGSTGVLASGSSYGVYASTPNGNAVLGTSGYVGGHFTGSSYGVVAINNGASGYGAMIDNGTLPGGPIYMLGPTEALTVNGTSTFNGATNVSDLCLGGVCKNAWPSPGTGDVTDVLVTSPLAVTNSGGPQPSVTLAQPSTSDVSDYLWVSNCTSQSMGVCSARQWQAETYPLVAKPAGSDQQLQYNNAGTMAGSSNFTYNALNGSVTLRGTTAEYRFSDRTNTLNLWSLYSNGGTAGLYWSPSVGIAGNKLTLSNAGALWIAGTLTQGSDIRLKNVTGKYSKGLDEISKLNLVTFNYKDGNKLGYDPSMKHVGLVAQDVQKVIPEAVSTNDDGYLMLSTDPILWTSVNAIKELKSENEALKAQNVNLETRLRVLEAKVEALSK